MKSNTLKIILKLSVYIIAITILFLFILLVQAVGPEPRFILDENYTMIQFPGYLMRKNPTNDKEPYTLGVLDAYMLKKKNDLEGGRRICAFLVIDDFIVGNTCNSRGWFAINRKNHKIWYPYESLKKLQESIGVNFSEDTLIKSFPFRLWEKYNNIKFTLICYLFFCATTHSCPR